MNHSLKMCLTLATCNSISTSWLPLCQVFDIWDSCFSGIEHSTFNFVEVNVHQNQKHISHFKVLIWLHLLNKSLMKNFIFLCKIIVQTPQQLDLTNFKLYKTGSPFSLLRIGTAPVYTSISKVHLDLFFFALFHQL